MAHFEQWAGFKGKEWVNSVDVRSFIQENYTPYEGDESFLEGPTEATDILWSKLQELQKEERAKSFTRFLQNIIKHTTREYSISIHLK